MTFKSKYYKDISSNDISDFFKKKLYSLLNHNEDFLLYAINEARYLTSIGVDNQYKYNFYSNIKNIFKESSANFDANLYKSALDISKEYNIKNLNDYRYILMEAVLKNKRDITKSAYPIQSGALNDEIPEQFNLEAWAGIVNKIYSAVESGDMSYNNALDYYSNSIKNIKERENFNKWISYYKSGEHLKYSNIDDNIKKNADYQASLHGISFYPPEHSTYNDESFDFESSVMDAKKSEDRKAMYKIWKRKLNSALRRIDKLLRDSEDYCSPEQYEQLSLILNKLDINVNKVRLSSTASDLIVNTANKLSKVGFEDGANILIKVAQEAPQDPQSEAPAVAQAPAGGPADIQAPAGNSDASEGAGGMTDLERAEQESDPVALEDLPQIPGAGENEYEMLAGNISLADASKKLEEVAGMLADRRMIRYLAEFDIMLDKLGIAAMFPELAESQAKLIDAYSYALTRVTKMLGMVTSSQTILEKAEGGAADDNNDGVPDSVQPDGAAEQEAVGSPGEQSGAAENIEQAPLANEV